MPIKPHIILLFLSLLFSNLSFAQSGTFTKMFTSNSYDEGIAAFRMPNKTYRIIANTGAWGWGSNNIWYIVLDTNAEFVKHKTIGYGEIDNARAATIDSKGNTYIVGSSTSDKDNSYQMLFIALDSSGALITHKYFGGVNWDFGNGIKLINDTTLILVGETYSYANQQNSDAWVMKINTSGNILWSKSFGGDEKDVFYAVDETQNGDLLCVGESQSYGNNSFNPYMIRCSTSGDSLGYLIDNDTTDGCFNDVKIATDSSYYLGGYQRDTMDSYSDFLLHKYSKDNQFLWDENYLIQKQDARINALAFHGNNLLFYGMTTKYGSSGENITCNKVKSTNGTWMDGHEAGDSGNEEAYAVTTDTSNGQIHYLIVGTSTSYNVHHTGVYFMRTNYNLDFDTTMIVDMPSSIQNVNSSSSSISLAYDPDYKTVKLICGSQTFTIGAIIKVYNMAGQCVYQKKLNIATNELLIDVSQWPKSSYSVIVSDRNNSFHRIIIVN